MLEFIKYLPLELRFDKSACSPKGPLFSKAKTLAFSFDDSLVTFRAPPHSPERMSFEQKKLPKQDLRGVRLETFNSDVMASNDWSRYLCFSRRWAYWGPWFSGVRALVTMQINIIGLNNENKYDRDLSFFHPKMFENVVADYLNDLYGHRVDTSGHASFRAPVDWKPKDIGIFSAKFQVQQLGFGDVVADPIRKLFFPVSDRCLVEVQVNPQVPLLKDDDDNRLVDPTSAIALSDAIVDSFSIQPSLNAKKGLEAACQVSPGVSLSKSFLPLDWPVRQPKGKGEDLECLSPY